MNFRFIRRMKDPRRCNQPRGKPRRCRTRAVRERRALAFVFCHSRRPAWNDRFWIFIFESIVS